MIQQITRIENMLLVWLTAAYAISATFGNIFQIPILKNLTSNSGIYIPAMTFFVFLLARYILRIENKIDNLQLISSLETIDVTHNTLLSYVKEENPKSFWATSLNPTAFSAGEPLQGLSKYYSAIEKLKIPDYRRIFGVLPKSSDSHDREKHIQWIVDHYERTGNLGGYKIRVIELDSHMVDIGVYDTGAHYAFPYANRGERGHTTKHQESIDALKGYFNHLWDSATPVENYLKNETIT